MIGFLVDFDWKVTALVDIFEHLITTTVHMESIQDHGIILEMNFSADGILQGINRRLVIITPNEDDKLETLRVHKLLFA
jgi:hypothetical protein